MSKKKLKALIAEQTAKIAKLEEDLKSSENLKGIYSGNASKAEEKISELHSLLDAIPGSPARKVVDSSVWGNKRELSVQARFTGLMASMVHRQFEPKQLTVTTTEG